MPTLFAQETLLQQVVDGKKVTLIRVILDGHDTIGTSVSENWESLASLVQKSGGVSGINGAYFCPADYAACGGKNTTNADRIWQGDGKTYSASWPDTGSRGIFGFDQGGNFLFVRNNLGFSGGVPGKFHAEDIGKIWYGLGNHPVLLQAGVNMLPAYENTGLIDAKMKASGVKNMICITDDEKTVYMGNIADITISEMPDYLQRNFGCAYALNLDSGGSLGMIYDGTTIRKPGRNIMDAFVVMETSPTPSTADFLASEGIIHSQSSEAGYELDRGVLRQEIVAMALATIGVVDPTKKITLPETYTCQNLYTDITSYKPNTWACRSIEIAAKNGLVTTQNASFRPEDSVSRAEAIAIILHAAGIQPVTPAGQKWEDVIMQYAYDHHLIPSPHLATGIPLTRREVFEIIEKSVKNTPVQSTI